jgi:hypothetical protein
VADPFADGTPVGDHHSWSKPPSEPCPYCKCCSEALCKIAVAKNSACHWEGAGGGYDLSRCHCWTKEGAVYLAANTTSNDEEVDRG